MDEDELRIAAVEKVVLAVAPWLDHRAIEDAAATLRAELQTAGGDERIACVQTLQLLTDGHMRFAPPTLGFYLRVG